MLPNDSNSRLEALRQFAFDSANRAASSGDAKRYAKLAHKLHQIVDGEVAALGESFDCQRGCPHCCHRLVTAAAAECFEVSEAVRSWPPESQEKLKFKLEAYQEATRAYWAGAEDAVSAPCPFLEDDVCSIYESRPISCRALTSRDVSGCRAFYREGVPDAPLGSEAVETVAWRIDEALAAGFRQGGGPMGDFELASAVAELLTNPDASEIPNRLRTLSGLWSNVPILSGSAYATATNPRFYETRRLFQLGDAEEAYRRFARKDSPFSPVHRLVLPQIYRSDEEIDLWWNRWDDSLTILEDSKLDARTTWEDLAHFQPFFLAYAGRDVRPFMERLMALVSGRWATAAFPDLVAPIDKPRRPGRLRVGYVGSRLTSFNGSRWALGWLRGHGAEFETYAFNLHHQEDPISAVWRRNADHYYHLAQPISDSAAFLRELDLDALIFTDIGMNGNTLQLASLRLARQQFTAWGHPVTSGSPMIDTYLSSELMEPEEADGHYTERLIRLKNSGLTYPRMRPASSRKSASDFGLPETGFYLVPQLTSKPLPADDWMFREIGRRSGKPIVFLQLPSPYGDRALEERLAQADVPAIVLPRQSVPDFMRLLELADCCLDPCAWNGGNTTIEALTAGTPVVSLSGPFMRGRHARAFLPLAGVGDLLAPDAESYVELALDLERQHAMMEGLHTEALYEDTAPAEALNRLLSEELLPLPRKGEEV